MCIAIENITKQPLMCVFRKFAAAPVHAPVYSGHLATCRMLSIRAYDVFVARAG